MIEHGASIEAEARKWRGEVLEIKEFPIDGKAKIEVTLSAAMPEKVIQALKLGNGTRHLYSAPPICILDHSFCSGIWFPKRFDAEANKLVCEAASPWDAIPGMKGGGGEPRTQSWAIDVPVDDNGNLNICFVPKTAEQLPCRVCIAPTLHFHCRTTFMSVNEIDTVTQSFKADVFIEFRARKIATDEVSQEIARYVLGSYGMQEAMFSFLNVLEMTEEAWTSMGTNIAPGFVDLCTKRRIQARFADKMDLQKFPFDQQE
eukprot:3654123-Rhodomonas_salina.1